MDVLLGWQSSDSERIAKMAGIVVGTAYWLLGGSPSVKVVDAVTEADAEL